MRDERLLRIGRLGSLMYSPTTLKAIIISILALVMLGACNSSDTLQGEPVDFLYGEPATGLTNLERNKYLHSIEAFSFGIEDDPIDTANYLHRGLSYTMLEQYELAISDLSEFIRGQQEELATANVEEVPILEMLAADAFNIRGTAYSGLGQFDRAMADFDEAVRLFVLPSPYSNRGNVYYALGRFDRAILDYDEAIKLYPTFPGFYKNRALAHAQIGLSELAEKDFQSYLDLGSN